MTTTLQPVIRIKMFTEYNTDIFFGNRPDCDEIRNKIQDILMTKEMSVAELLRAIDCSYVSFVEFLSLSGKDEGIRCHAYTKAIPYFQKRDNAAKIGATSPNTSCGSKSNPIVPSTKTIGVKRTAYEALHTMDTDIDSL